MKRKDILVDRSNAHDRWRLMNELREWRPRLEEMLVRYPVQISSHGFHCMVCNIAEVDELIAELEKGLALYRRQKPKHRRPRDFAHLRLERRPVVKAAVLRKLIAALQNDRDFIKQHVRRYPLECLFLDRIRFVFCSVLEVDWLIGELKRRARIVEREESEAEAFACLPWWKRVLSIGSEESSTAV
jgi:hypothetical protein